MQGLNFGLNGSVRRGEESIKSRSQTAVSQRERFIAEAPNRGTSPSMNKYERKHATMRDKNEFEHE